MCGVMSRNSTFLINTKFRLAGAIALTLGLSTGCGNGAPSNSQKTVNGVVQGLFNPGTAPALPYGGPPSLDQANPTAIKAIMGTYSGTMLIDLKDGNGYHLAHYQLGLTQVSNPSPGEQSAAFLTFASSDAPAPFTVKSWVQYGWSGYYGGNVSISSLSVLVPGLSTDSNYPLYISTQLQLALNGSNQIDPTQSMISFMDCGTSGIVCDTSVETSFLANIVVNQDLRKIQ